MIKKLESLEKYVITPNVRFYGGYVYNGEDIELCNDKDEEEGYKVHIQDKIIDGHLIKQVEQEYMKTYTELNALKTKRGDI